MAASIFVGGYRVIIEVPLKKTFLYQLTSSEVYDENSDKNYTST
ncbi:hypothetical protein [Chryseobacterium sp. BIGb0232]|nr:hypothetical protein [Chryseobacterium sp. BIGb0232]MCS4304382.1 hypothetical protein [Chryseobacterium sp. BIGb0232]ROS14267.1 hypothetical protein EDF65_3038 [Chryseobacterium nakagawai]